MSTCTHYCQGLKPLSVFALLFLHFLHHLVTKGSALMCSIFSYFSMSIWKRGMQLKCKRKESKKRLQDELQAFILFSLRYIKRKKVMENLGNGSFFLMSQWNWLTHVTQSSFTNNMWTFTHKSDLHAEEMLSSQYVSVFVRSDPKCKKMLVFMVYGDSP